jgi:hypothetical protein
MLPNSFLRYITLAGAGLLLIGCGADTPTGSERAGALERLPAFSSLSQSEIAQTLAELRQHTAPWHNMAKAEEAGYTTMLGCIDERVVEGVNPEIARGMGYHPANLALFDDEVDLLNPETLVYGLQPGGKLRLAAFDYFIPASETWPSPEDGGQPPSLSELGVPFTWSPVHNGWMFHIWAWWENPDGMFANFNPTMPVCECELDPQIGACLP